MNASSTPEASAAAQPEAAPISPPSFSFALVFLAWLPVVIVATLVTLMLPESFCSTARIKVEHDQSDIPGLADHGGTPSYDPYFIQTEFEVIQSQTILSKVVEDLDLNNAWGRKYAGGVRLTTTEAVSVLKNRLDVRPVRNTSLIEIRVFSEKPDEAAAIANAIAESYRVYRIKGRARRMAESVRALEEAYERNNERIRDVRAELAKLSHEPNTTNSTRSDEASRRLEDLNRFGQVLFTKLASEQADLGLPATSMVEIVDRALPDLRPVRPNKPLNIAVGIIVGGVGGFFLATLVYALQCREFRRRAALPRTPFPPRFRAILHILIALAVGVVIGYFCATPLDLTTLIVVPLTLIAGGIISAYIELANLRSMSVATGPPRQTQWNDTNLQPRH
jgi:uncharacterized protein involved in exopolysaccharide biosynthesis